MKSNNSITSGHRTAEPPVHTLPLELIIDGTKFPIQTIIESAAQIHEEIAMAAGRRFNWAEIGTTIIGGGQQSMTRAEIKLIFDDGTEYTGCGEHSSENHARVSAYCQIYQKVRQSVLNDAHEPGYGHGV